LRSESGGPDSDPSIDARGAVALLVPDLEFQRARETKLEPSEEALIVAIQRGDTKVGRQLYAHLIRIIDATLTRVMGPGQQDHDDWVQVAFEQVVRSIHSGRFQRRCRLTSWAASIACHVGLDAMRARKSERGVFDRRSEVPDPELGYAAANPERRLEARDDLRRLRAALATLSPGRAEAVMLHDALGYNLAEVAELTGSTQAAVQSRLVRGRRDLEERLGLCRGTDTKEPRE
jgi:RNA polymerase sigma-70 factor, ECF subfamily